MGAIAAGSADIIDVVNPRSGMRRIVDEITRGLDTTWRWSSRRETRNRAAIETARAGDVVLLAGKGTSRARRSRGRSTPFDDRDRPPGPAPAGGARVIPLELDEVEALRLGRLQRSRASARDGRADRLAARRSRRSVRRRRRRGRVDDARSRGAAATPRLTTPSRRSRARPGSPRPQRGDRGCHHRLDGEDVDEGHPGRHCGPPSEGGRGRGELQQRARGAADAVPLEPDTEVCILELAMRGAGRSPPWRTSPDHRSVITNVGQRILSASARSKPWPRRESHRASPAASRSCRRLPVERRDIEVVRRGQPDATAENGATDALRRPRRHVLLSRAAPRRECPQRSARGTCAGHRGRGPDRSHVLAVARRGDRAERRRLARERLLEREPDVDARRARGSRRPAAGRRTVAVLGEMAELGADSTAYHREIGALVGASASSC